MIISAIESVHNAKHEQSLHAGWMEIQSFLDGRLVIVILTSDGLVFQSQHNVASTRQLPIACWPSNHFSRPVNCSSALRNVPIFQKCYFHCLLSLCFPLKSSLPVPVPCDWLSLLKKNLMRAKTLSIEPTLTAITKQSFIPCTDALFIVIPDVVAFRFLTSTTATTTPESR